MLDLSQHRGDFRAPAGGMGMIPIVTHPERNQLLQQRLE